MWWTSNKLLMFQIVFRSERAGLTVLQPSASWKNCLETRKVSYCTGPRLSMEPMVTTQSCGRMNSVSCKIQSRSMQTKRSDMDIARLSSGVERALWWVDCRSARQLLAILWGRVQLLCRSRLPSHKPKEMAAFDADSKRQSDLGFKLLYFYI
jgi:hypothetical protein